MGNDILRELDIKDTVNEYFGALKKCYSTDTIKAFERKLRRFGVTDFKKLKTDFKNGIYNYSAEEIL